MRGTRQGQTIKLRLEGRLLCLWGLLGMEVPWKESQPSPPTHLGPQLSDPSCGPWATHISLPCVNGAKGQKAGLKKLPGSARKGWMK